MNRVSIDSHNDLSLIYSTPSHYLPQCWVIVNWTLRKKLQWDINQNTKLFIHKRIIEYIVCEIAAIFSRGRAVRLLLCCYKMTKHNTTFHNLLKVTRQEKSNVASWTPWPAHDDVIKWKHFPRYWPLPVPGEFHAKRPVTRSFDVFFDLRLNKRLSKQSWGWWFETLSRPFLRHCYGMT